MKRKCLFIILIVVLTLTSGVFVFADHIKYIARPYITNYPSKGENIIAFGDSLTYGTGSTKGNDYVTLLSRDLGVPIINKGIMGDTTAQALARIDEVIDNNPKVVIVYLGGNDVLQRVPVETTFSNLEQIIKKIQKSGAVVVLVGVRGGLFNDPFEERFENVSKLYHTVYVPDVMTDILGNTDLLSSDNLHPNDKGYELIEKTLYPAVKDVVK